MGSDLQVQIQAQSSGVVTYRLPSYGLFSTSLSTQYWFGLPRNVEFSGLNMDVDLLHYQTADKANDNERVVNFHQAIGSRASAMEHLVPEQMFSTADNPAHGISAVKALAIASAEGQKIWTIDQSNLELALGRIDLGVEVENEIRNAVNAGKVATAHELQINFHGWVGSGYLLIDPETGAGAYKIAGGGNGAFLIILGLAMIGILAVAVFSGFGTVLAPFIILSALAFISAGLERIASGLELPMLQAVACGFKWLFTGLALSRLMSVISFTKKLLKPLFNDLFNIVVGGAGVFSCL